VVPLHGGRHSVGWHSSFRHPFGREHTGGQVSASARMDAVTPHLRVAVLGQLRASRDGEPIDLGGPRQRALLARLVAAGGHVVSTDRLIEDLWSGEPPPKALAALQVYVSRLRGGLEPARARRAAATVLVSAAPGYGLALPPEAVDAWRFEALLRRASEQSPDSARASLEEALACWDGQAYAEFGDAPWVSVEVARLEELRSTAVEQRAALELARGRAAELVADLEQHLRAHPLREEAVRLLALALYRAARQADALAVLRAARERLADELGLDPGPALRALEADVLGQSAVLDAAPPARAVAAAAAAAATPDRTATSVGRVDELQRLRCAAQDVLTAGLRLVWVAAEAGGGKTTLVEVLAAEVQVAGWRVAWGRSHEVEGAPPAWAWSEVAAALGRAAAAGAEPFTLARDLVALLDGVSKAAPLLVVLDDVHRADELALQLLRQVAHELAERPVLLVLTTRATEEGDELGITRAALATVTAGHLELAGLTPTGVAALARESGLDVDPATLALLVDRTGGNPLFVRELARLLAAEGRGSAQSAVPAGVRDVLRRRLSRLPDTAQAVLRQAAVLGRDVDVDVLLEIAGRPEDDVLDALEAAVVTGLLTEPSPGRVRFAHALVCDTVYDDTPLLRRVRWHTAALRALQTRGTDVSTLAHHALAAATPATAEQALAHVTVAAQRSVELSAHDRAVRGWRDALRLHELAGSSDERRRVELLCCLVSAEAHTGAGRRARAAWVQAVALAQRLAVPELLVRALTCWDAPVVDALREDRAVAGEMAAPLEDALADTAQTDPAVRCRLLLALVYEVEGFDDARAGAAVREALEAARVTCDPSLLFRALNARVFLASGPTAERLADVEELQALAAATGSSELRGLAGFHAFTAAAVRGDLVAAQRHVDRALEDAGSGRLGTVLSVLSQFAGVLAVLRGELDRAEQVYTSVSRQMTELGVLHGESAGMVGRVVVNFNRGDLSASLPELLELRAREPYAAPDVTVLALLDAGREDDAREVWQPGVPVARGPYWLGLTATRGHAALRLEDLVAAQQVYDALLPHAGHLAGLDAGVLTFGSVDALLAELATALGDAHAAERHRAGADALQARVREQLDELFET